MPLTAYSRSDSGERDVEQTLSWISAKFGQPYTEAAPIPETVRAYLRTDLQCPSCFVGGAEIVRSAAKTGKGGRQSFFRFTTPGHHPHCAFSGSDEANRTPENLVSFTESKSSLTRAVRDLVCTGIEEGVFNQVSIRDMREWFFNKKVASLFVVSLDPRLPAWISALQENIFRASGALPAGSPLTGEIAALPQFDWRAEAARQVMERYPQHVTNMKMIQERHISMFGDAGKRAGLLAQRVQGRAVFDPTALASEYGKTLSLANFIAHNHAPLRGAKGNSGSASVLAFSALLLFIRGWDVSWAISDFVKIAAAIGRSNQDLGNVMGLNPFHDYESWTILKKLQELDIKVPEITDIKAERATLELALRKQFGVAPIPT